MEGEIAVERDGDRRTGASHPILISLIIRRIISIAMMIIIMTR